MMAAKAAVVRTFEEVGTRCGQPLVSPSGTRLFGGHSARVTGAQWFAEQGVETTKLCILARHSGEQILRYVADAPLKSLKADLFGYASGSGSSYSAPRFAAGSSSATSAAARDRLRKLESSMKAVEDQVHQQAIDVVSLATGFGRKDNRVFIQNKVTSAIHQAKYDDDGCTLCGWHFAGARKKGRGLPYRVVKSLVSMPSTMICERCMPTERALAATVGILGDVALSRDEHQDDTLGDLE